MRIPGCRNEATWLLLAVAKKSVSVRRIHRFSDISADLALQMVGILFFRRKESMARLEDIAVGASVVGLSGSASVSVIAVKWHGNSAMTVTYRNAAGNVDERLLYRVDEEHISVASGSLPWSFDADANLLRLASEAYRINLAHLFDPYLAVHTSAIEPLPHQITVVYESMLPLCREDND